MSNLLDFGIDWNTVEESNFDLLPKGSYAAKAVSSQTVNTKKGDGVMLKITFDILSSNSKFKNKKIFETYMLKHPNPAAVKIGLGRIKSLAKSIDVDFDTLSDSSEFHNKPVGVKVAIEKSEKFGDKNKITSFFEFSDDLLESVSKDEDIKVEEVVPEVEEVIEDEVNEEKVISLNPQSILDMKKDELISFVKDEDLGIDLKGKKISEIKDEVIAVLFDTSVDEEDLIIED